ncbi:MAG TPA: hypothetical protein VFL03_04000 [Candidatus Limnocylindrales bacterium]|nr:hypothetical protein [Candidatus Limnocylindrales bacterium]
MRCALIEFNEYHDEVLPTFVWLLNRLGITPDVYMVERSARRRAFARSTGLRYRHRSVETMGRFGRLRWRLGRYDIAIVNSMEPPENLDRAARLGIPVLGVVHNAHLLADDPAYRAFFAAPDHRPLVLGQHIAESIGASGGTPWWICHVVFGAPPRQPPTPGAPTVFAVTGNVEFGRRNYDALLDAAGELAADDQPFLVRIVGRSTYRDGKQLRATIEARGLAERFEFSPGEVAHPRFFRLLAESDFSLPLIDTSRVDFRPYLETKLASSVPFAIGLGVPLVANDALVRAYGIEGTGPTYGDGGLTEALRRAIASSQDERDAWRGALAAKREEILESSLANLRLAIAAVTGGR